MWIQTRSPEAFERITEVVRDVFPGVRRLLTWPTQQSTVFLASEERALGRPTPLTRCPTVSWLSSLTFPSCALRTILAGHYSIEEPENHLHPRLLETLVSLLRQTWEEVLGRSVPPSQVVLTTHSPYLVDQMELEEILWIEKKNGETVVVRPSEKGDLRRLVDDKALGLGDLLLAGALGA